MLTYVFRNIEREGESDEVYRIDSIPPNAHSVVLGTPAASAVPRGVDAADWRELTTQPARALTQTQYSQDRRSPELADWSYRFDAQGRATVAYLASNGMAEQEVIWYRFEYDCAASAASAAASTAGIPAAAQAVIDAVRTAASSGTADALRPWMVEDFTHSFGDPATIDSAIAAWRADAQALPSLARLLGTQCALSAPSLVTCPSGAGTGLRATFETRGTAWRFTAFVAGD